MRGADRISNLPREIIELILTHLPLKEAVRTSILSKAWRYRWTSIPHLVFDLTCCRPSCQDELPSIINHVFLLHTGSIQVLKLSNLHSVRDIDCWLLRASRSSVKELVLHCFRMGEELPSSLYTCNSLIRLEVHWSRFKLPSAFNGFKNLKTLNLCFVELSDDEFERLVSGCTSLEKLTLFGACGLNHMKINAPNLQCLKIASTFEDITFGDTHSKLSDIYILMCYDANHHVDVKNFLTQFFIKLPSIERLGLTSGFLERTAMGCGSIPERLPSPCIGLRNLTININPSKVKQVLVALCIFRSSPNLTELEIGNNSRNPVSPWPNNCLDGINSHCAFGKLRILKLHKLLGFKEWRDFIEFVVMNSPALEKIYITGCPRDEIENECVFLWKGNFELIWK